MGSLESQTQSTANAIKDLVFQKHDSDLESEWLQQGYSILCVEIPTGIHH